VNGVEVNGIAVNWSRWLRREVLVARFSDECLIKIHEDGVVRGHENVRQGYDRTYPNAPEDSYFYNPLGIKGEAAMATAWGTRYYQINRPLAGDGNKVDIIHPTLRPPDRAWNWTAQVKTVACDPVLAWLYMDKPLEADFAVGGALIPESSWDPVWEEKKRDDHSPMKRSAMIYGWLPQIDFEERRRHPPWDKHNQPISGVPWQETLTINTIPGLREELEEMTWGRPPYPRSVKAPDQGTLF
jgi:hypothetical protein